MLTAMSNAGDKFDGILAATGNRFLGTPQTERGSIFSTAAAQTGFLDSLPLRKFPGIRIFGYRLFAVIVRRPFISAYPWVVWKAIIGGSA
ncbi:MAG: hypothetical protein WDN04_14255 [Rhodospirillales bacterium]